MGPFRASWQLLRSLLGKLVSHWICSRKERVYNGIAIISWVIMRRSLSQLAKSFLYEFSILVIVIWLTADVASQSCVVEILNYLCLSFIYILRRTNSLLSLCKILNLWLLTHTWSSWFGSQLIWCAPWGRTLRIGVLFVRVEISILRLHILQRHTCCIVCLDILQVDELLVLLTYTWHLLGIMVRDTSNWLSRGIHKSVNLMWRWTRRLRHSLLSIAIDLREIWIQFCWRVIRYLTVSLPLSLNCHYPAWAGLLFTTVSHLYLCLVIYRTLILASKFLQSSWIGCMMLNCLVQAIYFELCS